MEESQITSTSKGSLVVAHKQSNSMNSRVVQKNDKLFNGSNNMER